MGGDGWIPQLLEDGRCMAYIKILWWEYNSSVSGIELLFKCFELNTTVSLYSACSSFLTPHEGRAAIAKHQERR